MPRRSDTLAGDELSLTEGGAGYSSSEDLWMFFGLAMLVLVFVLMNYVQVLVSEPIRKPPPEEPQTQTPAVQPDAPERAEVRIYVEPDGDNAHYSIGETRNQKLRQEDLGPKLAEWASGLDKVSEITIKVNAPGYVKYQHVFDACYPVWDLDDKLVDTAVTVHLEYEESSE